MSQAFVKESDEQWLHEVPPTLPALMNYLARENNGIRVYEKSSHLDAHTGKHVYEMSNGLSYSLDSNSQWFVA